MTNRQKEKIRNAVLYFVTHDNTVGLTKLMKLLFYLDFRTLQANERDVTGLVYRTWEHGPVPVDVWRELKDHSNDLNLSSVVKAVPFIEDPRDEPAGVRLRAVHGAKFSDRYFSPAELKELQNVSKMFKDLPASKVVEASHGRKELWSQVQGATGRQKISGFCLWSVCMKRGDVLYFPDWEFRDRGHADKLLVVMNTPGPADTENSKVVMLITTSQDKGRRKKDRGCQPVRREFFIPKSSYWNKDSWISFRREVEVRTVHQVQSAIEDKKCRIVTTLPETVINEIKNCMKRCCLDDLPRDVCEILGLKYGG